MNLVAIMIVRNEEATLPRCLEHLAEQGLTAAVVDNASTDRTREILASFAPRVVIRVDDAPFDGIFRWEELLRRAHAMQEEIAADWFHLNSPDEIFNSNRRGERLADAIRRIDAEGYNAVNYEEFVFIPTDEATNGEGKAFDRLLRHYYFYARSARDQMRSWKKSAGISNVSNGGHRLSGANLRIYPENLPLRHYIALSADHFRRKYRHRKYPKEELARGWHGDRVRIDTEHVRMPDASLLKYFASDDPSMLDRSETWRQHFWESPSPIRIDSRAAAALSAVLEIGQPKAGLQLSVIGRNQPCPCGSGAKYKNCHGRTVRDLALKKPVA